MSSEIRSSDHSPLKIDFKGWRNEYMNGFTFQFDVELVNNFEDLQ